MNTLSVIVLKLHLSYRNFMFYTLRIAENMQERYITLQLTAKMSNLINNILTCIVKINNIALEQICVT